MSLVIEVAQLEEENEMEHACLQYWNNDKEGAQAEEILALERVTRKLHELRGRNAFLETQAVHACEEEESAMRRILVNDAYSGAYAVAKEHDRRIEDEYAAKLAELNFKVETQLDSREEMSAKKIAELHEKITQLKTREEMCATESHVKDTQYAAKLADLKAKELKVKEAQIAAQAMELKAKESRLADQVKAELKATEAQLVADLEAKKSQLAASAERTFSPNRSPGRSTMADFNNKLEEAFHTANESASRSELDTQAEAPRSLHITPAKPISNTRRLRDEQDQRQRQQAAHLEGLLEKTKRDAGILNTNRETKREEGGLDSTRRIQKLEHVNLEHVIKIKHLEEHNARLAAQLEDARLETKKNKPEVLALRGKLTATEHEIECLKRHWRSAEDQQHAQHSKQLGNLTSEVDTLRESLREKARQILYLEEAVQALKTENASFQEKLVAKSELARVLGESRGVVANRLEAERKRSEEWKTTALSSLSRRTEDSPTRSSSTQPSMSPARHAARQRAELEALAMQVDGLERDWKHPKPNSFLSERGGST